MRLSRATHGGDHEAVNQTSPFIDQPDCAVIAEEHLVRRVRRV